MKALLALSLALYAGNAMAQDLSNIQLESLWFVFLVLGENRAPLDEEAGKKGMEGHLGNLTRLGNEGKALGAGPFMEDTDRRGIVILRGDKFKSKEEVLKEFANDPFVKVGRLKPLVYKWMTPKGSVHKWREPIEMRNYVFVILERGENKEPLSEDEGNRLQTAHLQHVFAMKDAGELGLAGPFEGAGDMRGLLVFKHKDMDRAKKLVAEDPLIQAGRLKATFLTLFMAAGVVGD